MVELELRLGESSRLCRLSFSGLSARGFKLLTLVKSVPGMAVRYSTSGSRVVLYQDQVDQHRGEYSAILGSPEQSQEFQFDSLLLCVGVGGAGSWWIFTSVQEGIMRE